MRRVLPLLLLSHALSAQTSATVPSIFKNCEAPGSNVLPTGRSKSFLQTWYSGQNLPIGMVATQIGWRYDSAALMPGGFTHTMEIVLDNTTATFSTLSTTFAANLSAAPTTFLPLQQVNWPAPPSGGLDAALWIPGAVPFTFIGPHLLVQVDVQTEASPRTLGTFYADGFLASTTTPWFIAHQPPGCAPSNLSATVSSQAPNALVNFTLTGGPSNSQAVFLLGTENQAFSGVNLLPLDLGFAGMTGCSLGVDPLASVVVPTNASGTAQLQGSLPLPTSVAFLLFAQALHAGNTPAGLVTGNVAGVQLGAAGLANYVYSWTSFGPIAEFGPYTTNRGAVVLLR
ncbi:MAG TPA: hypothetical protein VK081_10405 [Planctomycetota bacterium]|nr:hypothetical protein [Planctomycetota bacterium]